MILVPLLLLAAGLPSRTVTLSPAMLEKPVRVSCPVGQMTRIVFAEHFLAGGVKVSKGASDELGIALETLATCRRGDGAAARPSGAWDARLEGPHRYASSRPRDCRGR